MEEVSELLGHCGIYGLVRGGRCIVRSQVQGQSSGARLSPEKEVRLTQREVVNGKESVRRDGERCSRETHPMCSERKAVVLSELSGTVRSLKDAEDGE